LTATATVEEAVELIAALNMVESLSAIDVTDLMFAASMTAMIAVALVALSVSCWPIADE